MNVPKEKQEREQICPYLGQVEDAETAFLYPSHANRCYLEKTAVPIRLDHQENYCLSFDHSRCGVLSNGKNDSVAVKADEKERGRKGRKKSKKNKAGLFLLIFLFVLVLATLLILSSGPFGLSMIGPLLGIKSPTSSTSPSPTAQAASLTPSRPVITLSPSQADTITPTKALLHALEIPIGPKKLLIHQVVTGESLNAIASQYGTTVEAIKAINYNLPSPIWTNWLVVVPTNQVDVAGWPAFEAYRVSEKTQIEDLAKILSANEEYLKYYNALENGAMVDSGELLLIPHMAVSTP